MPENGVELSLGASERIDTRPLEGLYSVWGCDPEKEKPFFPMGWVGF